MDSNSVISQFVAEQIFTEREYYLYMFNETRILCDEEIKNVRSKLENGETVDLSKLRYLNYKSKKYWKKQKKILIAENKN